MAKKLVKRKKLKVVSLLIFLVVFFGLVFFAYIYFQLPVKNIIVRNTTYIDDDYILELADIKNYPSFILTSGISVSKKLEKSPYIEKARLKKKFFNIFIIEIDENRAIFYNNSLKKIILEDGTAIAEDEFSKEFRIPRLMNYVPDKKYKSFIKGMKSVDTDILGKISDIEYIPNDYDKDRFLLYMDDGNMVYLTLTKFKMINYYNNVLEQLEGKHGILYLDSGNHFQIKE